MKITLVMVTSTDGRSTKGASSEIHKWTSDEDDAHFRKLRDNASLIIMGSNTYETIKSAVQHSSGRLRIVRTSDPKKYEKDAIPGILEFTKDSARTIVKDLEKRGYTEGLLVGGAHTNTDFFEDGLITEVLQTIEPKILGKGNGLLDEIVTEINLELVSVKKLNKKGTLLLKYKVL